MELEQVVRDYQNKYLLSTPLYTDLGGGLNVRVSPPELKVSQASVCKNIIFNAASGALRPRAGTSKLIDTIFPLPALEDTWGMFQAHYSTGRVLLLNTSLGVWNWSGTAWVNGVGTAVRSAPVSKKVNMAFYNDLAIGVDGTNAAFKVPASLVAAPLGGSPPVCKFVVVWNDYVVMAGDGTNKVYYSERQDPENYPVANYLTAGGSVDGDEITGLAIAYGHLIIFKRNSIYAVSGATETDFSLSQIGRSTGLISPGAHCNAENDVWFLGPSGMYVIGPDLAPVFQCDYVLPRYQEIIAALEGDVSNAPSVAYNSSKQQVWVSVHFPDNVTLDKTMVHDLINRDASGRPAVSEYFFYNGGVDATNLNPRYLAPYLSINNEPQLISMNRNNYVYLHDVDLAHGATGDDGNSVQWEWRSKFLNLGDPMRLKTLRYYTVMGDSIGGNSYATDQNTRYVSLSDTWVSKARLNHSRRGCAAVTVGTGGPIYVIGGYDGSTLNSVERYDANLDFWTDLPTFSLPVPLAYGSAVSDGTYIYYLGGWSSDTMAPSKKVYRLDLGTGIWTAMADMPSAKYWFGCDIVAGKIYCIGGCAGADGTIGNPSLDTVYAYDIALGTWSTKTPMPSARCLLTSTSINGKIYNIGGFPLVYGAKNEEYDTVGNTWATKTPIALGRYEHFAFPLNGKVNIAGGYYGGTERLDAFAYDPALDSYSALTSLPSARYWGGSVQWGNDAFLMGGKGAPATLSFHVTDDFANVTDVTFDLLMNTRKEIPATANYQKRYWSISFVGNIVEGVTQITGWNLDYTMFQRRN